MAASKSGEEVVGGDAGIISRFLGPLLVLILSLVSWVRFANVGGAFFTRGQKQMLPNDSEDDSDESISALAERFKDTFSRKNVRVHFVGVWSVFILFTQYLSI